jgi:SAM-dependent methyltransferase
MSGTNDIEPEVAQWQWDPTLYAGSAAYYSEGRIAYPDSLADALRTAVGLDGRGSLLDVGCGPGSLTLLLAPLFETVTGIDADADMVRQARRLAESGGIGNSAFRHLRAEELPADLGPQRMITFAQSFHWMDRPRVAAIARNMLAADGVCVHVHATTHRGVDAGHQMQHPQPPWSGIEGLISEYLGPVRRAGQTTLPSGTAGDEAGIYRAAGFAGPRTLEIEAGRDLTRTEDEIVASVFSLSSAAPHLFGTAVEDFERDLRALLRRVSPECVFSERLRDIRVDIWSAEPG